MKVSISMQKEKGKGGAKKRSSMGTILPIVLFVGIIGGILAFSIGFGSGGSAADNGQFKPITFSKLSSFEYIYPKPGEQVKSTSVPPAIRALHGEKVSIRGFMLPYEVDKAGNVKEFSLNGSFDMCFYGAPVEINEWVMVESVSDGVEVKYTHLPIMIQGTLEVGEKYRDGQLSSLYRLKLENVSSS